MQKYYQIVVSLSKYLAMVIIVTMSLIFCYPVLAITQELQFNTPNGYLVKTTFSYDESKNPNIIQEKGTGKTKILDSLQVDFYQPSGKLIASYNNIVDGLARGTYFEFNFAPATKQLLGNIDLGGESTGEIYLKGDIGQLYLIKVETFGEEKIIDRVVQAYINN